MKVLIEGEKYPINILESIFDDSRYYNQIKNNGIITSVGYYHSFIRGEVVYLLPKVFMRNQQETIFGINKLELLDYSLNENSSNSEKFNWLRVISILFYKSLIEYRRRKEKQNIINRTPLIEISSNLNKQEFSYLDLLLSFVNFFKKNNILFIQKKIQFKSKKQNKVRWEKTIIKSTPLLNNKRNPIYDNHIIRKKISDYEDELLLYFMSILNRFNEEHDLNIAINKNFKILKGEDFNYLKKNGLRRLKKIRYKYFNDDLLKMYKLCEIYFQKENISNIKKRSDEFLIVNNYNIIFEDMVDKLFSDSITNLNTKKTKGIEDLKINDDGKIIDHIFEYDSIIDTSNIFYIGDSKYYKSNSFAGKLSKYKQFTYSKNIIQYNIDLFNNTGKYYNERIRYRDPITEGYNITPNFFLYGFINNYENLNDDNLEEYGEVTKSYHFNDRLFDRDTLFIHQYRINFLFILKNYSSTNSRVINKFRIDTKKKFKNNFLRYFNDNSLSKFTFYEYYYDDLKKMKLFISKYFRSLIGKIYITNNGKLILAKYNDDNIDDEILKYFIKLNLK